MDDGHLLLEVVEAFTEPGERDAVRGVLLFEPAGAETEVDATVRHLVDLGDRDRERSGHPERGGGDEGPEADRRRLAGDRPEGDPRIGRSRVAADVAHLQEVVAAEERPEAQPLGALSDGEQGVVGGTLLGLGEDAEVGEFHAPERYKRRFALHAVAGPGRANRARA